MTPSIADSLNEKQLEAVLHERGPLLVLAGAGSGKTRVLTHRIADLISRRGIHPARIFAVTFTNKAASEMKERLKFLVGEKSSSLWVSTFHSACVRILRAHADKLGYPRNFTIYDEQDSRATLKNTLKELGIDEKRHPIGFFQSAIDRAKNELLLSNKEVIGADDSSHRAFLPYDMDKLSFDVYFHYQNALKASGAMDFGDLLVNATLVLTKNAAVLREYRSLFEHILVDEFQDTNRAQYVLLKLIATPKNNLFIVGDDDQSIYSFRGAVVDHILTFEKDFPSTKVIRLEQNYRSTKTVLSVANSVISMSKNRLGKTLWTENDEGAKVLGYAGGDEIEEASFIAGQIRSLVDTGTPLKEIAIFYRTNAQSRAIEEALLNSNLPYRIFGGVRFYERKEVKDLIGYLRILANPKDEQAFLRIVNTPPRGIGIASINKLRDEASRAKISLLEAAIVSSNKHLKTFARLISEFQALKLKSSISKLIREIIDKTDYEKRLLQEPMGDTRIENLKELEAIAKKFECEYTENEGIFDAFLDRVTLSSSQDESGTNESAGFISLMTLHLAKGLEFPYVFLTGMEEGLLPHYRALDNPREEEEERRLCYVGITRAMRVLYMTRAHCRGMFTGKSQSGGVGFFRVPSRYLGDIPPDLIEPLSETFFDSSEILIDSFVHEFPRKPRSRLESKASIDDVKVGFRVDHPSFGEGTVLRIEDPIASDDKEISVIAVKFDEFDDEMKLTWKWSRLRPIQDL